MTNDSTRQLPLWEGAYHLASRGAFLADELYSEWARERRALLAGHYRQCVHELTHLYRERGGKAEAVAGSSGCTPIVPRNGANGILTPGAKSTCVPLRRSKVRR